MRRKNRSSRIGVVDDPDFYKRWALSHPICQACYRTERQGYYEFGAPNSVHHLIKFRRSDEATNLLRLCGRDHNLAEGLTFKQDGVALPKLTLGVCLTIKQIEEPEDYDADRLAVLYGRPLPQPEPIPEFLLADRERFKSNRRSCKNTLTLVSTKI